MRRQMLFYLRLLLVATAFLGVAYAALLLADFITTSEAAQRLVNQFGYLGVFVLAIVAGLNAVVPIPAATFTPVFAAAGLLIPIIIIVLTLGTLVADLIGFLFGRWSRALVEERYPHQLARFERLKVEREHLIPVAVMIYAAVMPFPNEAMLIPLAILGVSFQRLLPALFIGNAFNQAALAYGFSGLFTIVF